MADYVVEQVDRVRLAADEPLKSMDWMSLGYFRQYYHQEHYVRDQILV